jgi:hypothetical protein
MLARDWGTCISLPGRFGRSRPSDMSAEAKAVDNYVSALHLLGAHICMADQVWFWLTCSCCSPRQMTVAVKSRRRLDWTGRRSAALLG